MTTKQAKSETLSGAEAPERIYLQWFGVDAADVTPEELAIQPSPGDLTWCTDKQFDTDVEYIRADVGRLQGLEEANRALAVIEELLALWPTTEVIEALEHPVYPRYCPIKANPTDKRIKHLRSEAASIREKIKGAGVGAQEEKQ